MAGDPPGPGPRTPRITRLARPATSEFRVACTARPSDRCGANTGRPAAALPAGRRLLISSGEVSGFLSVLAGHSRADRAGKEPEPIGRRDASPAQARGQ